MNIQLNISNNLKAYRKKNELSQEALAERLGITSQAVSKWECMQSIPDIETVVAIAGMLRVSIDELLLGKAAQRSDSKKESGCVPASVIDNGGGNTCGVNFNGEVLRYEDGPDGTDIIIKVHMPSSAKKPKK